MMLAENLRISVTALTANKLRTALSIIGITIGVLSVVLLLSLGAGASNFVRQQIDVLGTRTLIVYPKGTESGAAATASTQLTARDVQALSNGSVPDVDVVAPEAILAAPTATAEGRTFSPRVVSGVTGAWPRISNRSTAQGVLISDEDVARRGKVAVVGETVATRLFRTTDVVGRELRVGDVTFEIIGVFTRQGTGLEGDGDSVIVVPLTTMQSVLTGTSTVDAINLRAREGVDTEAVQAQIRRALDAERRITDPAKRTYDIFDSARLLETSGSITTALTALLGLIAGISLLVGGIGVMNIMLVTVTERTREIGIRKALGAKRPTLLGQFLIEAVMLTGIGGFAGMAGGAALSRIKVGEFAADLQPWMLGLAAGVSVFIGVVFGIYPANRAAKLRPIDALRYE